MGGVDYLLKYPQEGKNRNALIKFFIVRYNLINNNNFECSNNKYIVSWKAMVVVLFTSDLSLTPQTSFLVLYARATYKWQNL